MLTLEEISGHIEIRNVLAAYARGVDRWDVETLKSCYHDDASDQHTMFNGNGHDFADFIVDHCSKAGGISQHHVTHSHIDVSGDRANVESYYIAFFQVDGQMLVTSGRYLDRFERRNDAWKIARRVCTIDLSRPMFPNESWDGARDFPKIGPKGVDPLYALLAEA